MWKMDPSRSSGALSSQLNDAWTSRVKKSADWNSRLDSGTIEPSWIRRFLWTVRTCGQRNKFQKLENHWRSSSRSVPSLAWSLNDAFGRLFWTSGINCHFCFCLQPNLHRLLRFVQGLRRCFSAHGPLGNQGKSDW